MPNACERICVKIKFGRNIIPVKIIFNVFYNDFTYSIDFAPCWTIVGTVVQIRLESYGEKVFLIITQFGFVW